MITEELMQPGQWNLSLGKEVPATIREKIVERGHILITRTALGVIGISDTNYKDASIYTGRVDRIGDLGTPGETPMQIGGTHISVWMGDADGRGVIFDTTKAFSASTWSAFITSIRPASVAAGTVTNNPTAVTGDFFAMTAKGALDHQCPISGAEWRVNNDGTLDSGTEADLFVTTPTVLVAQKSLNYEPLITARHSPGLGVAIDSSHWVSEVHLAGTVDAAAGGEDIIMATADLTDISKSNPYKDFQGNADATAVLVPDSVSFLSQAQNAAEVALEQFYNIDELITLDMSNFNVSGDFQVGDTIYVYHPPRIADEDNQVEWMGGWAFPKAIRVYAASWPVRRGMGVYYRDKDGNYTDLSPYVDETGEATIDVGVQKSSPIGTAQGIAQSAVSAINQPPNVPADITTSTGKGVITDRLELNNLGNNPSASDGPDDFPEGYTYNNLSSATGWPVTDGWVETFIDTSTSRAYQIVRPRYSAYSFERFYATATTWGDWRLTSTIKNRDATSTQYDIVSASTLETARTVTVWTSPPSNFQAEIHVTWQMWVTNATAANNCRAQVGISRDGGSTWTTGLKQLDHISGTSEFGSLTVHCLASGSITGNIQARLQVQSSHADTKYDDMDMIATIGPNW